MEIWHFTQDWHWDQWHIPVCVSWRRPCHNGLPRGPGLLGPGPGSPHYTCPTAGWWASRGSCEWHCNTRSRWLHQLLLILRCYFQFQFNWPCFPELPQVWRGFPKANGQDLQSKFFNANQQHQSITANHRLTILMRFYQRSYIPHLINHDCLHLTT